MNIHVFYFASVREALKGIRQETLVLASHSSVEDALNEIQKKYSSELTVAHTGRRHWFMVDVSLLDPCMFAINEEYVDRDQLASTWLKDGDVLAIIPRVSGG
ncbi:hypothetical protein HDU91_003799 [Kappamyces sp. JEL0680]|nr:hypothetical protein HDU91_003799 [Kappamyces sp. JEL0680]